MKKSACHEIDFFLSRNRIFQKNSVTKYRDKSVSRVFSRPKSNFSQKTSFFLILFFFKLILGKEAKKTTRVHREAHFIFSFFFPSPFFLRYIVTRGLCISSQLLFKCVVFSLEFAHLFITHIRCKPRNGCRTAWLGVQPVMYQGTLFTRGLCISTLL